MWIGVLWAKFWFIPLCSTRYGRPLITSKDTHNTEPFVRWYQWRALSDEHPFRLRETVADIDEVLWVISIRMTGLGCCGRMGINQHPYYKKPNLRQGEHNSIGRSTIRRRVIVSRYLLCFLGWNQTTGWAHWDQDLLHMLVFCQYC